jgi:hypothetical protein
MLSFIGSVIIFSVIVFSLPSGKIPLWKANTYRIFIILLCSIPLSSIYHGVRFGHCKIQGHAHEVESRYDATSQKCLLKDSQGRWVSPENYGRS